FVLDY
ncbi:hypothetical protein D043_3444B, partial [Vibrio parahaemolyticus EKP-021]